MGLPRRKPKTRPTDSPAIRTVRVGIPFTLVLSTVMILHFMGWATPELAVLSTLHIYIHELGHAVAIMLFDIGATPSIAVSPGEGGLTTHYGNMNHFLMATVALAGLLAPTLSALLLALSVNNQTRLIMATSVLAGLCGLGVVIVDGDLAKIHLAFLTGCFISTLALHLRGCAATLPRHLIYSVSLGLITFLSSDLAYILGHIRPDHSGISHTDTEIIAASLTGNPNTVIFFAIPIVLTNILVAILVIRSVLKGIKL